MRRLAWKYRILALLAVMAGALFGWHAVAGAAAYPIPQSTIPTAGDFTQGSSVALIVAIYGNGYVLDSPTSTVRLYSPNKTNSLNIINGGNCPGTGGDVGPNNSETQTTYFIYSINPDALNGYDNTPYGSTRTLLKTVTNKQIKCDSIYQFSFTSAEAAVGVGPASGQYAFEIEAVMSDTGGPGWNQFKYQIAGGGPGRLSYYAGAGDHFAIKAVDGTTPNPGDFHFGLAPGCGVKSPETAPLKWFDEDAGQSNQGFKSPVRTEIIEYNNDGTETNVPVSLGSLSGASNGGVTASGHRILDITSGNNVGGFANVVWRPKHKYAWIQYGIYDANGIQFQLPFDSYNTLINYNTDCPNTGAPDASCTATPSTGFPAPNTSISMKVKVTNTSGAGGPTFNSNYEVRQVSPGGQVKNLSGNLAPGSTDVNIPPFAPIAGRPAGTTVIFTYQLFDGSGTAVGASCSATVTWNAGGPISGAIDPECDQTKISGINVNDNWHPPKGAAPKIPPRKLDPVKDSVIPAQVKITDVSSGVSFIYDTGGVPNDGSTVSFNTFDMGTQSGNKMWPHKKYSFQLIIQGNGGFSDSLAYNDDGKWTDPFTGKPYYSVTTTFPDTPTTGDCLHLTCGPSSSPDIEPGQSTTFSSSINYTNQTEDSYDTNPASGYYFHVNTDGGFVGAPGDIAGGSIGPGGGTVTASFTARLDYTGNYSITFMFQGNPLDLGQGNPCPDQQVTPATKPFLQVWGGDINTGGGFETLDAMTGAFSCPSSYPDYVSPSTTGDSNSAGIKTFGAPDGTYGSLSDFGALSLGSIAKNTGAMINFGAQPSFANTVTPEGQLDSSPPAYCEPDFFDSTQKDPAPTTIPPPTNLVSLSGSPTDQYIVSGSNVDSFGGGVIPAGRKITLFVKGDITITGNITYSSWDPNNPDTAPSFALIVEGNINIDPGVTRIDGLYVAQPSSSGNDGEFNTCANNGGNQFCNQQFVANGAVIARVIMPLRSVGTVSPDANPGFAPPPGHVPAEIFNYIPCMVICEPNFAPIYNSLEGLFNLPPVF